MNARRVKLNLAMTALVTAIMFLSAAAGDRAQTPGGPDGTQAGGRIWSPYFKNLTPETLAEARSLGLLVSVWTPDSPDDLRKMIEMQVDAITTNRPDVLKGLLEGR